jgi:type VI secretion system protein ImpH
MATKNRPPSHDLTWLERLERDPGGFDFHVALRRFETSSPDMPRLGEAVRPTDEPLRVGQTPSSSFEPTAIADFVPEAEGAQARLLVSFLGLWGPHGPLPSHLTEYASDRARHSLDHTLTRFVDIFHHRMLLIFHRAWAKTQPTVGMDRRGSDRFAAYVGAFVGIGMQSALGRDRFPDRAKLFYAGRFAGATRNAEGLAEIVGDYFQLPTAIEEFIGEWLVLPADGRWELGVSPATGSLGRTAVLGGRVWSRSQKFRIVMGPLSRAEFERMLPNSEAVATLSALVRFYAGDEWEWDLRLVLSADATEPMRLARGSRLGWTTRIGPAPGIREDLIVDPALGRTRRVQASLSTA